MAEKFKGDLVVLAISGEKSRTLQEYAAQTGVQFIILQDKGGDFSAKMAVPALPAMMVIDRQGIIRHTTVGGGSYFQNAVKVTLQMLKE